MQEITLLFHFIGLGLLVTTLVAGFLLHRQYRKAADLPAKALILRAARPIGLLSPVGMLIMIVTGIGNMHYIHAGLLTLGWLSAKLVFFTFAVIAGILLAIAGKKRAVLVMTMAAGNPPEGSENRLASIDRLVGLGYIVMPLLLLAILYLSTIGRLGAE